MDSIVEPLPKVLYSIIVFHFISFYFLEEMALRLWNWVVVVVWKC